MKTVISQWLRILNTVGGKLTALQF